MNGAAVAWALASSATGTAKLVLIAIAAETDEAGEADISVARLGEVTGVCPRAVRNALTVLDAAGLLERRHRAGALSGYRCCFATPAQSAPLHNVQGSEVARASKRKARMPSSSSKDHPRNGEARTPAHSAGPTTAAPVPLHIMQGFTPAHYAGVQNMQALTPADSAGVHNVQALTPAGSAPLHNVQGSVGAVLDEAMPATDCDFSNLRAPLEIAAEIRGGDYRGGDERTLVGESLSTPPPLTPPPGRPKPVSPSAAIAPNLGRRLSSPNAGWTPPVFPPDINGFKPEGVYDEVLKRLGVGDLRFANLATTIMALLEEGCAPELIYRQADRMRMSGSVNRARSAGYLAAMVRESRPGYEFRRSTT